MNRFRTQYVVLSLLLAALAGGCGREALPEKPPRQLSSSPFRYPEELWDAGVEGETILRIFVTPQGTVDSARVEKSSGHTAFDQAAAEGAKQLRFEPGRRGDQPVGMWVLLPVQFQMNADSTRRDSAAIR